MTTNEAGPQQSSISSERTDALRLSDPLLVLGRKLVEELAPEDSTDTLGRWMAHYIADLILKAESARGDREDIAKRECASAILDLWRHRLELPSGKRPFQELEPVVRAVESLDPENNVPRYFRAALPPKDETADTDDQKRWLDLADGIDHTAKVLIGFCLAEAANASLEKTKEWVRLAATVGDDSAPEIVIRFIVDTANAGSEADPNEPIRCILKDRIARLRGFLDTAEKLSNELQRRLDALPSA